MRRLVTAALITAVASMTFLTVGAQVRPPRAAKSDLGLAPVSRRPDLGVDYPAAARMKLASRKETYHLGEMISLDVAMLNRSKDTVFLLSSLTPEFHVRDESGKEVIIGHYGFPARGITPSMFKSVGTNEIITEHVSLLVGCDRRAFDELYANPEPVDDLKAFENNLFVNWGSACLRIERPGTYFIDARVRNDYVVTSTGKKNSQTAVGEIKSNELQITVVE